MQNRDNNTCSKPLAPMQREKEPLRSVQPRRKIHSRHCALGVWGMDVLGMFLVPGSQHLGGVAATGLNISLWATQELLVFMTVCTKFIKSKIRPVYLTLYATKKYSTAARKFRFNHLINNATSLLKCMRWVRREIANFILPLYLGKSFLYSSFTLKNSFAVKHADVSISGTDCVWLPTLSARYNCEEIQTFLR